MNNNKIERYVFSYIYSRILHYNKSIDDIVNSVQNRYVKKDINDSTKTLERMTIYKMLYKDGKVGFYKMTRKPIETIEPAHLHTARINSYIMELKEDINKVTILRKLRKNSNNFNKIEYNISYEELIKVIDELEFVYFYMYRINKNEQNRMEKHFNKIKYELKNTVKTFYILKEN